MTIMQFGVCGFLVWPFLAAIRTLIHKHAIANLWEMLFGGLVTGLVGCVLGLLWNL